MRRFLRFSMRAVLVLLIVVCLVGGYIANKIYQQRKAVARIVSLGGEVFYDWQFDTYPRNEGGTGEMRILSVAFGEDKARDEEYVDARIDGPKWVRNLIGNELYQSIAWVVFQDVETLPSDAFTDIVDELQDVDALYFIGTAVDDRHMEDLGKLPNLVHLQLEGTLITAAGLKKISHPEKIKSLAIDLCKVDDRIWPLINSKMKNLLNLSINSCPIEHVELIDLKNLEMLQFSGVDGFPELTYRPRDAFNGDATNKKFAPIYTLKSVKLKGLVKLTFDLPNLLSYCEPSDYLSYCEKIWLEDLPNVVSISGFDSIRKKWNGYDGGKTSFAETWDDDHPLYLLDLFLSDKKSISNEPRSDTQEITLVNISNLEDLNFGSFPTKLNFHQIQKLKSINLEFVTLNDQMLQEISKLTQLEELGLSDSDLTDEQLEYLTKLPNLRVLEIDGTQVTELGVAELLKLSNLEELSIADTCISKHGAARLKKLPRLVNLWEERQEKPDDDSSTPAF